MQRGPGMTLCQADRRVVFRIHEETGSNVMGLQTGHRLYGPSAILGIFSVDRS